MVDEIAIKRLRVLENVVNDMARVIATTLPPDALDAMERIGQAWDGAVTEIGSLTICDHEWTDCRNEVVESGEICLKCNSIRAAA